MEYDNVEMDVIRYYLLHNNLQDKAYYFSLSNMINMYNYVSWL